MSVPAPHFFLFSEANREDKQGYWSFVLRAADGSATYEAADCEPQTHGERLDLLAVVRGLEALDQPSRVTLVTPSRYVNRGIAYGLDEWGRNGWTWESFGQMVPVKNRDLWQRLDRALKIHRIEAPIFRPDPAHVTPHAPKRPVQPPTEHARRRSARTSSKLRHAPVPAEHAAKHAARPGRSFPWVWKHGRWVLAVCSRWSRQKTERWRLAISQLGTSLLPAPWID